MKYDRMTRWLHAGIALGVMVQLFSSLFMDDSACRCYSRVKVWHR